MKSNILIIFSLTTVGLGLEICPYTPIKKVIRATIKEFDSAPKQMVEIQRVMEELVDASWGVVIVEDPVLITSEVHWSVPSEWHINGKEAFCVTVINGWQYNVFMVYHKQKEREQRANFDHYPSDKRTNETYSSEFSYE